MELELRSITEDEHPTWSRHIERAFGNTGTEQGLAAWRSVTELDRTIAALENGDIVGTAGAFSFAMALPGGSTVPVAGVTAVSVRSTHRRRGVLREMMRHQLDDVVARGEPIAILTASETPIYGRFGYGLASRFWAWSVKTEGVAFASPSRAAGRMRLVEKDEAAKVLPDLRERIWRRFPGELSWSQAWWDNWFLDLDEDRGGASALWFAIHESENGEADGYVAWRTKPGWERGLPNGEALVNQLYGFDDEIEAALWQYVLSIDLVTKVSVWGRPVDDPIRWRLLDPRRLRIDHDGDHLWLRLLDIERALAARELGSDERLVVEVADDFMPQVAGTYAIEPGRCERSSEKPDLTMHVRDLAALYLGCVSATTLARAGRIEGTALQRADRMFASSTTPWCSTGF